MFLEESRFGNKTEYTNFWKKLKNISRAFEKLSEALFNIKQHQNVFSVISVYPKSLYEKKFSKSFVSLELSTFFVPDHSKTKWLNPYK
jgi:hypothetical protein